MKPELLKWPKVDNVEGVWVHPDPDMWPLISRLNLVECVVYVVRLIGERGCQMYSEEWPFLLCMCAKMSHGTQNCIIPSYRISLMNYSCPDRYIIDGDALSTPDWARSFKTIAPATVAGGGGRMLWSLLEPKDPEWCWFFHHVLTCRYPLTVMMNRDIFDDPLSFFSFSTIVKAKNLICTILWFMTKQMTFMLKC